MAERSLQAVKTQGEAGPPAAELLSVPVTARDVRVSTYSKVSAKVENRYKVTNLTEILHLPNLKGRNETCIHMASFHFTFLVTHFYCPSQKHRSTMNWKKVHGVEESQTQLSD